MNLSLFSSVMNTLYPLMSPITPSEKKLIYKTKFVSIDRLSYSLSNSLSNYQCQQLLVMVYTLFKYKLIEHLNEVNWSYSSWHYLKRQRTKGSSSPTYRQYPTYSNHK